MWSDVRYGFRRLLKAPLFSAVVILSLALGIGANTAIFTLLDQVILRLLPVRDPRALALLTTKGNGYGSNRGQNAMSHPMYLDFAAHNTVFSGLMCKFEVPVSLTADGRTERISGELVSGTYFDVLGVGSKVGRLITPEDDKVPGGHPVVVLSYDFWKTRFAQDRNVVGKSIILNGHNYTVIGVSEEGFTGVEQGSAPQVRVPVMMKKEMTPGWDQLKDRRSRWVNVFGRLKPGVTFEQAKASLQPYFTQMLEMEVKEAAFARASQHNRDQFLKATIDVLPGSQGRSGLRNQFSKPLWVLMTIVLGVLLIACANVANLLLARAATREKEIAVRLALGASRGRLVRQLLIESLLLAAIGAVAGVVLATWTDRLLLNVMPIGSHFSATPDLRILGFTALVTAITGVLFGLAPALQSTKPNLATTLKDQAGAVAGSFAQVRLRKALVIVQIALSLLLLIGAGLFISSLRNLKTLSPGFKTTNLISFTVQPSLSGYKNERARAFFRQLQGGVGSAPGIESLGLSGMRLIDNDDWESSITVEGYQAGQDEDMNPFFNDIGPGFFASLGIPVIEGRDFNENDNKRQQHGDDPKDTSPTVVMVNEAFAKKYFAGKPALGRHIGFGGNPGTKTDMEIIGVVGNAKYNSVRGEMGMQVFIPYLAEEDPGGMTGYVRTAAPPTQVFAVIREEIRKIDPNVPVYGLRTIEDQVNVSLQTERMVAGLSAVFGALATLLAVIGLYGVMAYTVSRRTKEVGIRMALGATQGHVVWMVMAEVLIMLAIGVGIAVPAALALSKYVSAQVYGIAPRDPLTMIVATLILAVVAALAGFIPARRAARIDPMLALRWE